MKVAKWGNSLAVRIPAALIEALELKDGDEVEFEVTDRRTLGLRRKLSREEAIRELRKFRGLMPEGYKFDRDEANER